jgi:ADP-ribose pyrophosphatase
MQTLSRALLLDHSHYLRVENHVVQLPNGRVITAWPWIITPDYVNICVVDDAGQFLCFRQNKYGIEGESLAPVGGYLEPGEDPLLTAQRELREEMGYAATHWQTLGRYCVDGNRGAGTAHLFLAAGAHFVGVIPSDDLERQALVRLSRVELERALAQGEFKVLPWATVMALGLRALA